MASRVTLMRADDASLSGALPSSVNRSALARGTASSGTPTYSQSGTAFRGGYRAMSGIGDYVEFEEIMQAGTWTLVTETVDAASGGTFTVSIDGAVVATKDTYIASGGGATLVATTGIVIAASGRHKIRLTVVAKNASSSATTCRISGYTMDRTGA